MVTKAEICPNPFFINQKISYYILQYLLGLQVTLGELAFWLIMNVSDHRSFRIGATLQSFKWFLFSFLFFSQCTQK